MNESSPACEIERMEAAKDGSGGSDPGETPTGGDLPLDALFNALADQRRRYLLRYLAQNKRGVTVEDIAGEVVAKERSGRDERTGVRCKQVETQLRRDHLPLLQKEGIVNHDEKSGTVTLRLSTEKMAKSLNQIDELERKLQIGKVDDRS